MTFNAFGKAADLVILSSGWRRRGIAFLAGAVGALAMAPVDFFPAMLVPMMVAVWLIDGIAPDAALGHAADLLRMLKGRPASAATPHAGKGPALA